jgi:hypothetical protein
MRVLVKKREGSRKLSKTKAILLPVMESRIKRRLRLHLKRLGFIRTDDGLLSPPSNSKESFRALHRIQREDLLLREKVFIKAEWPQLKKYFANGAEVDTHKITPRLELIKANTWQSRLFRLACLTWSIPVSQGYGRRMRFLVWDKQNGKLIGLIGLGDPVFNLKVRDDLVGWTSQERKQRLVNILDAFVLGSVPPYNMLLGGKLIACLVRTKTVRNAFAKRYAKTRGVISRKQKRATLVLVTTSSALGRSSVYNRLALDGHRYFESIGYTSGWGHFHIPQKLFELIRVYLKAKDHKYAGNNRFGDGPNWKLRATRHALSILGLKADLLRHGIAREVFVCNLATNAKRLLKGEVKRPRYVRLLSVTEVAKLAKARWIEPRGLRYPDFRLWRKDLVAKMLNLQFSRLQENAARSSSGNERLYGTG